MASFTVTAKDSSFGCTIAIAASSGSGHKFDALDYKYVITPGKAVDKVWIKARAGRLEAEITKQLNHDISQFETYRTNLIKDDTFAKRVQKEAQSKKLDAKKAQAHVEEMIATEMDERWKLLRTVTFPAGIKKAFDVLLKTEDATISKELAKSYKQEVSTYSKRPLVTIAATTAAAIAGILTGTGAVAVALAALGGVVSLASVWIKHRKEVALNVASVQNADGALRTSVEQAEKALTVALKAIATLESELATLVNAEALKDSGDIEKARAHLSQLDTADAKKAMAALQQEGEARKKFIQNLVVRRQKIKASKAALDQAQALVMTVRKDTIEGADSSKAAIELAEKMQSAIDDGLKFLKAALSGH